MRGKMRRSLGVWSRGLDVLPHCNLQGGIVVVVVVEMFMNDCPWRPIMYV